MVIEPEDRSCPCCGGALHQIGVEETERLDAVPLRLRVRVTRRPIYGCRSCAEAVVQAPAPDSAIPGGLPTEALLAQVAVSKYSDGLPLTARPRSWSATASISTAPPCRTGWAGRRGG